MNLTYSRPHRLAQLADEIGAALPALFETTADGRRRARWTIADVSEGGDGIILTVPDDISADAIAAVVGAHVPVAPPAPPAAPSQLELNALRDFMTGTTPATIAGLAAVLRAFIRLYRFRAGREE